MTPIRLRRIISGALALAVVPGAVALGAAAPAAAKEERRPVHIVRTVAVDVPDSGAPEAWRGRLVVGLVTTGVEGRLVTRPAPVELTMTRTTCDLGGCVQTVLTLPDTPVPASPRMASGLRSARLGPVDIGVRVLRVIDGVVVSDRPTSITVQLTARRSGSVTHEARAWTEGSTAFTSIVQTVAARTSLRLGGEALAGTRGQLTKVYTVATVAK